MKVKNLDFKKRVEEAMEKYPHIEIHIQKTQSDGTDPLYLINVYGKETPEAEVWGYLGRSKAYAVFDKKSMLEWRNTSNQRKMLIYLNFYYEKLFSVIRC